MFQLKGKIAVVTGAGSGIGKAVALLFAKQGGEVHVMDLKEEDCSTTVMEIQVNNGKAIAQICDVTTQQHVKEVFNKIGKVDILVNSAGVSHVEM